MTQETKDVLNANRCTYAEIIGDYVPRKNDENVCVCFCSSNEYAPILSVAMASLLSNVSPSHFYDIVVLTCDMSADNMSRLSKLVVGKPFCSLRFMNINKLVAGLSFYTWAHFTAFTYYRLIIPDLFKEYDKVLYLDSDIVVNADVSELYNVVLDEEHWLAAAIDTHVAGRMSNDNGYAGEEGKYFKDLGLEEGEYFQAGVMLINIKRFLSAFQSRELVEGASKTNYRWLDQDYLNVLCHGKVKFISNRWNVMILNTPSRIDENHMRDDYYDSYIDARANPYIIHYVGRSIPCFNPTADMYQFFWEYARITPYYELLLALVVKEAENRAVNRMQKEFEKYRNERLSFSLKRKVIDPIVNIFFPKGTIRRDRVRNAWWKFIGK